MDASARQKAEMAQKIAQELLKSSSHRLASTLHSMPALNTEQSNLVRAAQQKAAEIAVQVAPPLALPCLSFPFLSFPGTYCWYCFLLACLCAVSSGLFLLSIIGVFLLLLLATHSCYFCLHGTCSMTGLGHVAAVHFLT